MKLLRIEPRVPRLKNQSPVFRPTFWVEKYDELVAWLISQGTNSSNRPYSVLNDYDAHIVMNGFCNVIINLKSWKHVRLKLGFVSIFQFLPELPEILYATFDSVGKHCPVFFFSPFAPNFSRNNVCKTSYRRSLVRKRDKKIGRVLCFFVSQINEAGLLNFAMNNNGLAYFCYEPKLFCILCMYLHTSGQSKGQE